MPPQATASFSRRELGALPGEREGLVWVHESRPWTPSVTWTFRNGGGLPVEFFFLPFSKICIFPVQFTSLLFGISFKCVS